MKNTILLAIMLLLTAIAHAQDKLFMHNGTVADVAVMKVAEFTIMYTYKGEKAEQVVSKYAVEKIAYGSGRTENITPKILVGSESDWENVVILLDKSQVAGLTQVGEVGGKTKWFSQHSAAGAAKKATKKLKQNAADLGCEFILVTSKSNPHYALSTNYDAVQEGVAYKY